jgi:hypothetical protein
MERDDIVKEVQKGNYKVRVIRDENPENPRTAWDNLGTMVCFHNRYDLGDKNHGYKSRDFNGWGELEKQIIKDHDPCVILPLYLYDHSGITMNTTGFSCRWDSGQVGFIFISKKKVREEYNLKRITKEWREKVQNYMVGEVETYDEYLTGQVYGYEVIQVETCSLGCEHEEHIDSCWGYYGDIDYCLTEGLNMIPEEVDGEIIELT